MRRKDTGGYYLVIRPPGELVRRWIPLTPEGGARPTRQRGVAEAIRKRLLRQWQDAQDAPEAVAAVLDAFHKAEAMRSSQRNANAYRQAAGAFLKAKGIVRLWEVGGNEVAAYLSEMGKTQQPGTVRRHYVALCRFFRYCQRKGLVDGEIMADIEVRSSYRPAPRPLTAEADAAFIARLRDCCPCLWPAAALARYAGLRLSELSSLRFGDLSGGRIIIGADVAPKGYQWRTVPICPELRAALATLPAGQPHDRLFRPRPADRWVKWFKASVRGLPGFGANGGKRRVGNYWHCLRATWATEQAGRGVSPWELMATGGWASLQIVMSYVRLAGR